MMKTGNEIRKNNLSRRQFLKVAGVGGGIVAVSSVLAGYGLYDAVKGDLPVEESPFDNTFSLQQNEVKSEPLLIVLDDSGKNPFSAYLMEILLTEGISNFQTIKVSQMDYYFLGLFPAVVLADCHISQEMADSLEAYVAGGGKLIALRTTPQLAHVFGVKVSGASFENGYIRADENHPTAAGMASEALQFFGPADEYILDSASVIAWCAPGLSNVSWSPAVTVNRFGQGQAWLWAFDLAYSVALTRQGNPRWANQERDDRDGLRAQDMFVGWIDLERIRIPQADEQMRLFSRIISESLADALPLPRLWYFPDSSPAMLIATGDAHACPGDIAQHMLDIVEVYSGGMSIYYTPPVSENIVRRGIRRIKEWAADIPGLGDILPSYYPTPNQVAGWRARGHEFGLHPYVEEGLEQGWREYWNEFTSMGYTPVSPTTRTHRILWKGWVETARVQAQYGMRMNLDYYHYGPAFKKENGEWVYGHFTGSGLPMKFIDEDGKILDIYQQNTQLVDEHLIHMPWGIGGSNVGGKEAVKVAERLLDESIEKYPAAFAAQFHIDPYVIGGDIENEARQFLEGTLAYAASKKIPIWSAEAWLLFSECRRAAKFSQLNWDSADKRLSCEFDTPTGKDFSFEILVPEEFQQVRVREILVDGKVAQLNQKQNGGLAYAGVTIQSGTRQMEFNYA